MRRIIASAACVELALFHPSLLALDGSDYIYDTNPEIGHAFHDLREAIAEAARYGSITPALLRMVGNRRMKAQSTEVCRKNALSNIEAFSRLQFHWVPANKIRNSLFTRAGIIGGLREKLESSGPGSVEAARSFAKEYRDRAAIIA